MSKEESSPMLFIFLASLWWSSVLCLVQETKKEFQTIIRLQEDYLLPSNPCRSWNVYFNATRLTGSSYELLSFENGLLQKRLNSCYFENKTMGLGTNEGACICPFCNNAFKKKYNFQLVSFNGSKEISKSQKVQVFKNRYMYNKQNKDKPRHITITSFGHTNKLFFKWIELVPPSKCPDDYRGFEYNAHHMYKCEGDTKLHIFEQKSITRSKYLTSIPEYHRWVVSTAEVTRTNHPIKSCNTSFWDDDKKIEVKDLSTYLPNIKCSINRTFVTVLWHIEDAPQANTIEEKVQRYSLFNVKIFAQDKLNHSRNVFDGYLSTRQRRYEHHMKRNGTKSYILYFHMCVKRATCTHASKSCVMKVPKDTKPKLKGNDSAVLELDAKETLLIVGGLISLIAVVVGIVFWRKRQMLNESCCSCRKREPTDSNQPTIQQGRPCDGRPLPEPPTDTQNNNTVNQKVILKKGELPQGYKDPSQQHYNELETVIDGLASGSTPDIDNIHDSNETTFSPGDYQDNLRLAISNIKNSCDQLADNELETSVVEEKGTIATGYTQNAEASNTSKSSENQPRLTEPPCCTRTTNTGDYQELMKPFSQSNTGEIYNKLVLEQQGESNKENSQHGPLPSMFSNKPVPQCRSNDSVQPLDDKLSPQGIWTGENQSKPSKKKTKQQTHHFDTSLVDSCV
ncbi:uncharacterized protein [Clytia hemisphaerica]|uniref:Cnidarian restricted protein n=1 Tax=Clytia hemisphaerica TaxID=252671 RepID=A0A7M5UTP7_9CNID